jgi:hypothetical protein
MVRLQRDDGSWAFDDAKQFANAGSDRSHVTATALALETLAAAGYTHREGNQCERVEKGLKFLLKQQTKEGDLRGEHGDLIAHAAAAGVLCALVGMSDDKDVREPAQRAIDFLQDAADPARGGWGTQPKQKADLESSVHCFMALKTAHMNYFSVRPQVIKDTTAALARFRVEGQPQFGFQRGQADPVASAMGLCMAHYLNQKELRDSGAEYLIAQSKTTADIDFRYYAVLVLNQTRGDAASKCRAELCETVIKAQTKDGPDRGSWFSDSDRSAKSGGRLYQSLRSLQILLSRPSKFLAPEDDFPL